ncbi:pollen Ole e 1 allergen and extensin family protein [Wolffia australiana]
MSSAEATISPGLLLMLPLLLPLLCWAIGGAAGDATVTGAVFCDQCRDGQHDFLDYPLSGATVAVACGGGAGAAAMYAEATTDWFGSYCVGFAGEPDLSSCSAMLVAGAERCGGAVGPAQLHLVLGLFGSVMYAADDLLAMPAQASSPFCPQAPLSAAGFSPSALSHVSAACPSRKWAEVRYRCHWKGLLPGTKAAAAFGAAVGRRYGREITLKEALRGRGDVYRVLLREATAALLNSHRGRAFFYSKAAVVERMNWALSAPPREALRVALRFKKANSGSAACGFTPCF